MIPDAYFDFAQHKLQLDLSDITPDPSLQFTRETWFDHVRDLYAVSKPVSGDSSLGLIQYDCGFSMIVDDIRFIFKFSPYWFSFFNVTRFYNNFLDPYRRSCMQPSLLLALLAVSRFLQSGEEESPAEARRLAMLLRDEAQGYLEASLHARAIDIELAEAAWVCALSEEGCRSLLTALDFERCCRSLNSARMPGIKCRGYTRRWTFSTLLSACWE